MILTFEKHNTLGNTFCLRFDVEGEQGHTNTKHHQGDTRDTKLMQ